MTVQHLRFFSCSLLDTFCSVWSFVRVRSSVVLTVFYAVIAQSGTIPPRNNFLPRTIELELLLFNDEVFHRFHFLAITRYQTTSLSPFT